MKKQKRSQENKPAAPAAPERSWPSSLPAWWPAWWQWLAALAGLFVVFEVYGPALNGPFVLDDLNLPYMAPNIATRSLRSWFGASRWMLSLSYWVDYQISGSDPHTYHVVNVIIHFLVSVLMALIAARLLAWAGVAGRERAALSIFAGALFLLHPVQTESVAYVASRSESLAALFYFASFAVFLYRNSERMTPLRACVIVALFGAAAATKEHTLTLPLLLLLTDYFWGRGGIRQNWILYGLFVLVGGAGAVVVYKVVVLGSNTTGFRLQDLTPTTYFYTEGRVVWTYIRLFFLPLGQNVDPDVPLSHGPLEYGAIFGLLALAAAAVAAWIYRKRWPLASFGVLLFLLLLAPTSSFVPIRDVLAERRLYLPFLGLTLVCLEFLRRLPPRQTIGICAAVCAVCAVLTYQRSEVWATPLALWEDTTAKSPAKQRPRFQLAFALYEQQKYPEAAQAYEIASRLGPQDSRLLVDWALALDGAGRDDDALDKLHQASLMEPSAYIFSQMGMIYGKRGNTDQALYALSVAEKTDPRFAMTYFYRGNVYAVLGDRATAASEYKRALDLNPSNEAAREALARVSR